MGLAVNASSEEQQNTKSTDTTQHGALEAMKSTDTTQCIGSYEID